MKWFFAHLFNSDLAMFFAFILVLAAGGGIGLMIERHSHNSCVVELARAGKTVEEAKGVCK